MEESAAANVTGDEDLEERDPEDIEAADKEDTEKGDEADNERGAVEDSVRFIEGDGSNVEYVVAGTEVDVDVDIVDAEDDADAGECKVVGVW